MAKKRQMRDRVKSKQKPKQAPAGAAGGGEGGGGGYPEVSSTRVQRKVAKSVRFLEKLQSTRSALATRTQGVAKRGRKKGKGALRELGPEDLGLALGSLAETLKGALPEAERNGAAASAKKLTPKAKQRMIVHEKKQLNAVLEHPAFKADPFETIHQHLQQRLPTLSQEPAQRPARKKKAKRAAPME